MKRTLVLCAALAAASSLGAQAPATPSAPAGWSARMDKNVDAAGAKFYTAGSGLHFTTGPAGTWYRGAEPVDGQYTVGATFTQTRAPMHPESYGLMLFGRQMETPTQSYVYFMVRGDGKWALKHRANDTDVHTIVDWTASPAIVAQDAKGEATNKLAIDVGADSIRYLVNGQQVLAQRAGTFGGTQGVVGIRMNHGLDVHVADFAVTKK